MAAGLPPPPLNSPNGSYYWLEWYTNLTNILNSNGLPFTSLSFTGSDISLIQTRNHNELTNIQGGTATGTTPGAGNAWHVTGKGYVSSSGTGTGMPTGWSISETSTGVYTLVTGLSTTLPNIGAIATSNTSGVIVEWIDLSNTGQVIFHLVAINTTTPTSGNFTFIVST
jgi:hypothetical protein